MKKANSSSGYSILDLGTKKSAAYKNRLKKYEESYNEDYFEYRMNKDKSGYHLYCPYTGETILNAYETFYRTLSYWGPIDGEAYSRAENTVLYPEVYASRTWGRRKFNGWGGNREAARIHLQAVCRGFLARARLRNYYRENYHKILDIDSMFYYFVHKPTGKTSWHKPLMANNHSIPIYEPDRYGGFSQGPIVERSGIGKANIKRKNHMKERIPKIEDKAIPPIDFDNDSYMAIQYWLDGYVPQMPKYNDLVLAFKVESWADLYHHATASPDDQITQFYCMYKGSVMKVKIDVSGLLEAGCAKFFNYSLTYLPKGLKMKYGSPILQFVCYAILNIIQQHAGRNEFFNTDEITTQLSKSGGTTVISQQDRLFENAMIEKYLESRLDMFCKYLTRVPVEIDVEYIGVGAVEVSTPTNLACEMVELIIQCIALLAHFKTYREVTAFKCTMYVLQTMKLFHEQVHILCLCMKALYNFVYLCESAHMYLVENTDVIEILRNLRASSVGPDPEIQRDCRKLELALEPEGWRGNIEAQIGIEMTEDRAKSLYITDREQYFENLHAQKIEDFKIEPGSEYDLAYAPEPKHFQPHPVTSRVEGKNIIKLKVDPGKLNDPLALNADAHRTPRLRDSDILESSLSLGNGAVQEQDDEEEDLPEPGSIRNVVDKRDIFQQAAAPIAHDDPRFKITGPVTLGDILDESGFIKLPPKGMEKNMLNKFLDGSNSQSNFDSLADESSSAPKPKRILFTPAVGPPPKIQSNASRIDTITKRNNSNLKI